MTGIIADMGCLPRMLLRGLALRFRLSAKTRRQLSRRRSLALGAEARNGDAAGGTLTRATLRLRYRG